MFGCQQIQIIADQMVGTDTIVLTMQFGIITFGGDAQRGRNRDDGKE